MILIVVLRINFRKKIILYVNLCRNKKLDKILGSFIRKKLKKITLNIKFKSRNLFKIGYKNS